MSCRANVDSFLDVDKFHPTGLSFSYVGQDPRIPEEGTINFSQQQAPKVEGSVRNACCCLGL